MFPLILALEMTNTTPKDSNPSGNCLLTFPTIVVSKKSPEILPNSNWMNLKANTRKKGVTGVIIDINIWKNKKPAQAITPMSIV